MAKSAYRIRMKRGHNRRLRFWFCPVNEKIMKANQDWDESSELSCDNICTKELFYPFIEKHYPGEFLWRNELNLMPFENVREMTAEVRKVAKLMSKNFSDPRIAKYTDRIDIDLLVDSEEYEEKYMSAPAHIRRRAVADHAGVVVDFYQRLCDWLDDTVNEYEPRGYHAMAIFSPH